MKQFNLDTAEIMANQQRAKWGISESDPIHLKTLLRKLNILTLYRPLSDQSYGLSVRSKDNKCFMLINSNQTRGRQHFTIAHELFHLFVDENPQPHLCKAGDEDNPNEKNANKFASCLLMPRKGVFMNIPQEEICNRSISMATVLKLEQFYGVSHQAMAYRLKWMKLISSEQLQNILNINIKDVVGLYGMDNSLYTSGNEGLVIGDYGSKARILYESDRISEGHYNELMNLIFYGKD